MTRTTLDKKNTILLIRNAYSYDFGGGERIPVNLADELRKHAYNPTIISRSAKLLDYAKTKDVPYIRGWWWSRQDWSGKKIVLIPLFICWQIVLFFWYLRIITKTRADIVHAQSRDDFIAATLAGKLLKKKIIWSDHADLKYVYQNNPVWYKNPIGKLVFRLSKGVSTVILTSKSDKKQILDSLGVPLPSNYKVIYNGVASAPVKKIERSAEDKDAIIFGATSRLVTEKGIVELIDAFQDIDNKLNVRLWLFGEGPEEKKFKDMAKDNKNIVFFGFPDDSLSRLASCDVFVHPSYNEGFSISLIEAAKLGLPTIACNVGGNPEIITDNNTGILVDSESSEQLAGAMDKLARDRGLRTRLGTNIRAKFEKDFAYESIVAGKIIPLYEQ